MDKNPKKPTTQTGDQMRIDPQTQPAWLPSQIDLLRADAIAWHHWRQQNRHVRLTRRVPPRPINRGDLLLAATIGALASAIVLLVVVAALR